MPAPPHAANPPVAGARESALLRRINAGFPPEVWDDYRRLTEARDREELAPADHAELIRLSDQLEEYQADRVAALVDLAELRGTTLPELADALGFAPLPAG